MNADPTPEVVAFITIEEGDDLIVSFAIADEEPGEIVSLTLFRTPKYEFILPTDERGVSVSQRVFSRRRGAGPLASHQGGAAGCYDRDDKHTVRA